MHLQIYGQHQQFATVYPVIYRRKPDVINNVPCDWSMLRFYVAEEANVRCQILCF